MELGAQLSRALPRGFSQPQCPSLYTDECMRWDAVKGKSLIPKCSELLMSILRANSLTLGKFSLGGGTVERMSLCCVHTDFSASVYGWILLRFSALSALAQGQRNLQQFHSNREYEVCHTTELFWVRRQQHPGCKKDTCGDPLLGARGLETDRAITEASHMNRPWSRVAAQRWRSPARRRKPAGGREQLPLSRSAEDELRGGSAAGWRWQAGGSAAPSAA
ncbi:hypothetical protein DV515_00005244, partial [Chloebia gouldiae]